MLLDPNTWSETGQVSLGIWAPSWDGKKVAFNQRPYGNDEAVLHVVDVDSGEWSKTDVIKGTKYGSPSWTPNARGFYYTWVPTDSSLPAAERPGYKEIRFHRLGTAPEHDEIIVPKTGDPTLFQVAQVSRDGKYLFLVRYRLGLESELWLKRKSIDHEFLPLAKAKSTKYEIYQLSDTSRAPDVRVWQNAFYILTDEGAPNRRLFRVAPSSLRRSEWREVISEDKSAALQDATIVGHYLALQYSKGAASEIRITTLEGKPVRTVSLPDLGSATRLFGLPDKDDAYFEFSSLTLPRHIYKTSLRTGKSTVWAKVEHPIDPRPYHTQQVWYPSKDGTAISMFIVAPRNLIKDGSHPVLLYGYGGFGLSELPGFRTYIYPWLESGGIFALASLRGGGEYGEAWHRAGRLHTKQNVFDDFIAAADYLIKENYTQPARLAIYGGSNGGLLVGAAMTQRLELFGAVICSQPLMDMVRYPLFGVGKAWLPEYGDPENLEDLKVLLAYSPYHRVTPAQYPPFLMLSPDRDDRVDPMHARKFIGALQNANVGSSPALLRVESNTGHQGSTQLKGTVDRYTDMFAFLFDVFGMKPAKPFLAKPSSKHHN